MLIKIVTVASVLTVCNASPRLHPNREEAQSNQAVSSQSFTREDVPLAYKFQAVHTYSTSKPNPEETQNNAHSHHRAYSHESAHYVRQPQPQNAQYLRPNQQTLYHPQNIQKYPVKSLQYAPIPHNVQNGAPYFKPTTREELQKGMVPYRVIYVNPTATNLDGMSFPDSTPNRVPLAHSVHLSTYRKNPYQTENANNVGMQKIMYPQLLQMFQEHRQSTSINQHTQLPHLPQRHPSNVETAGQDLRQPDHYIRFQSSPQKPHFQTDDPKAYQFVPVKNSNHQHHPDRPYSDDDVQYPAHTQAIFRTNAGELKAEPSENVKITYLYPVTVPRTPLAHR